MHPAQTLAPRNDAVGGDPFRRPVEILSRVLSSVLRALAGSADAVHVPLPVPLQLPLQGEAGVLQDLAALRRSPVWNDPAPRREPFPVVLVGGMGSNPVVQRPMRLWLERAGHPVVAAPVRWGLDCGERTTRAVLDTMERTAGEHGRRVALVAHSRGGQYARVAAVRRPELTAGLVTLGSPLVDLFSVHRVLRAQCVALGLAGTLGVPGLFSAGCLWGDCCRRLRAQLAGPFPASVPFVSVYSPCDEVVTWSSCLDRAARHVPVVCSHGGLLVHPEVYEVLDRELSGWDSRSATAELRAA